MSPRKPDADVPPSLLLVDKSGGMTSHDVVARARRVLSVRKVGHAGTLDPMATGLLVLGVGTATRLLGHLSGSDKTYDATLRLGQAAVVWWFLALMQPVAGVVFALDGVLMGAGDVAWLRTVTIAAALVGFLPLSLLSGRLDWGLPGVWTGLTLFVVLRLVAVGRRVAGDKWLAPETVAA